MQGERQGSLSNHKPMSLPQPRITLPPRPTTSTGTSTPRLYRTIVILVIAFVFILFSIRQIYSPDLYTFSRTWRKQSAHRDSSFAATRTCTHVAASTSVAHSVKQLLPNIDAVDKLFLSRGAHLSSLLIDNRTVPNGTLELARQVLGNASAGKWLGNKCKTCVVVGSGSCLRGRRLGKVIDSSKYSAVIRVNEPPLSKYDSVVGSRTDIRVVYPESAPGRAQFYRGEGIVAVVAFKPDDVIWAVKMADTSRNLTYQTWKSSPKSLPVKGSHIALVHPSLTQFLFGVLGRNQVVRDKGRRGVRPTTGTVAIYLALHMCQRVDVAGFCYSDSRPDDYAYYYGGVKMKDRVNQGPHLTGAETELRAQLIKAKLIHDLTGAVT